MSVDANLDLDLDANPHAPNLKLPVMPNAAMLIPK